MGFAEVLNTNPYCGDYATRTHFTDACNEMTPCVVDSLVAIVCHFTGILVFLGHVLKRIESGVPRYRLSQSSLNYQWATVIASTFCLLISIAECLTRLSGRRVLYSVDASPAPYECLVYSLPVGFWFFVTIVLYLETRHFVWKKSWIVRFSLCLALAGRLTKLDFVLTRRLTRIDVFYFGFMFSILCQFFLTILSLSQIPESEQALIISPQDDYEPLADSDHIDIKETERKPMPDTRSNIFSRLLFCWVWSFLKSAAHKTIQLKDIWQLDIKNQAATLQQDYGTEWPSKTSEGSSPRNRTPTNRRLYMILFAAARWQLLRATALRILEVVMTFIRLSAIVSIYETLGDDADDDGDAKQRFKDQCIRAIAVFLSTLTMKLAKRHYEQVAERAGFRVVSMIKAEIQKKALFLFPSERPRFPYEDIKNLALTESRHVKQFVERIPFAVLIPVDVAIVFWIVYGESGYVTFGMFLAIAIVIYVLSPFISDTEPEEDDLRKEQGDQKMAPEERIQWEKDLVSGIYSVKCHGWERPLARQVSAMRSKTWIARFTRLRSLIGKSILSEGFSWIAAVLLFLLSSLPRKKYAIPQWFICVNAVEEFVPVAKKLNEMVTSFIKIKAIISPLKDFLNAEEQHENETEARSPSDELAVHLKGDFSWNPKSELKPCLRDLDIKFLFGSVTVIFGPNGSGKTSLLSSIIGLTQSTSNSLPVVHGRLALVDQSPFLLNDTIQKNILFGQEFDEKRYDEALQNTDLESVLETFPRKDRTLIGEQGIKISKSQKARIALARAFYSNADIILLDNRLFCLDKTSKQNILIKEIERFRNASKAVILVTNDIQLFRSANQLLYLKNGKIAGHRVGDEVEAFVDSILQQNPVPCKSMPTESDDDTDGGHESQGRPNLAAGTSHLAAGASYFRRLPADQVPILEEPLSVTGESSLKNDLPVKHTLRDRNVFAQKGQNCAGATSYFRQSTTNQPLVTQENSFVQGEALLKTAQHVILAIGGTGPFVIILCLLFFAALSSDALRISLACGADLYNDDEVHDTGIFEIITIFSVVLSVSLWSVAVWRSEAMASRASSTLHGKMLSGLLRKTLSFYRETPMIQIIERLRKINHVLDDKLQNTLYGFLRYGTDLFVTLFILAVTTPLTLLVFAISSLICFFLFAYTGRAFLHTKQLSVLVMQEEAKGIAATLDGLSTIRAFSAERYVFEKQCEIVDKSAALSLIHQSTVNWMVLVMDICSEVAVLVATMLIFAYGENEAVEYLAFSYTQSIATDVSTFVLAALAFELDLSVIEQALDDANLEPESEDTPDAHQSVSDHSSNPGCIKFENVTLHYSLDRAPVVNRLMATIETGEHIAVVGRYGKWRSVLPIALYRFVELSEGQILFDGKDISKKDLRSHRNRISFLPRVPFVVTGTVRMNLDPTRQDDHDDELWDALNTAQLKKDIEDLDGLDVVLQRDDRRLDNRQKQLLCLARVILEKRQILIVDEGEGSKDTDTVAKIYQIVQEEFRDKTVITMTNRPEVIQEAHKVMVLNSGKVVAYGSPEETKPDWQHLLDEEKHTDPVEQQGASGSTSHVPAHTDDWTGFEIQHIQEEKERDEEKISNIQEENGRDEERISNMQYYATKMAQSAKWEGDSLAELGPQFAPLSDE